ncbi:MAG: hypothetical protein Q9165_002618 [Trypethelium subeluteriae]
MDVELVAKARLIYGACVPRVWGQGTLQLPLSTGKRPGTETRKGEVQGDEDKTREARNQESGTERTLSIKEQQLDKRQLLIYEMELLPGHPYSLLQPQTESLSPSAYHRQLRLVHDLASFLARGYHAATTTTAATTKPTATPTTTAPPSPPPSNPQMTGKVGPHLTLKLSRLAHDLPTTPLRARAQRTLSRLHLLRALPLVLNHGDVVPSNLLVERETFELCGVVDWAEAEVLPWGVCAYGVEYALGWLANSSSPAAAAAAAALGSAVEGGDGDGEGGGGGRRRTKEWVYYDCAASLRRSFWDALAEEVPALREEGGEVLEAVRLARDVGVLLWYGYAWDEGLIDRVVNWERDEAECVCLEAFLGVDGEMRKDGIEAKL